MAVLYPLWLKSYKAASIQEARVFFSAVWTFFQQLQKESVPVRRSSSGRQPDIFGRGVGVWGGDWKHLTTFVCFYFWKSKRSHYTTQKNAQNIFVITASYFRKEEQAFSITISNSLELPAAVYGWILLHLTRFVLVSLNLLFQTLPHCLKKPIQNCCREPQFPPWWTCFAGSKKTQLVSSKKRERLYGQELRFCTVSCIIHLDICRYSTIPFCKDTALRSAPHQPIFPDIIQSYFSPVTSMYRRYC